MKMTLAAAAALAGSVAFGETLTWNGSTGQGWDETTTNWKDASQNPVAWTPGAVAEFANGALKEVSLLKGQTVSGLLFSGTDAATTLSGNPLTFVSPGGTAPATIRTTSALSRGNVIAADVSDSIAAFDTETSCLSGTRVRDSKFYLPPMNTQGTGAGTNVLYWTNRDLSDIAAFQATILHRDKISGVDVWEETPAQQITFTRGTENGTNIVTATFNCRQKAADPEGKKGGVWGFGVVFSQVGANILARVKFTRFMADYDANGNRQNDDDEMVFGPSTGAWAACNDGVVSGYKGDRCGSVGNILAGEGTGLAFQDEGVTTCTNAVYGNGLTVYGGAVATREPVRCFKNARLADVDAFFCDFHLLANAPTVARGYNLTWNGDKLRVSFQQYLGSNMLWSDIGGTFTGIVDVDFWQDGNDIYAQWAYSGNCGLGWNFSDHSRGVIPVSGKTNQNGNYAVSNIRLRMKPAVIVSGQVDLAVWAEAGTGSACLGSRVLDELKLTGSGDMFFSPADKTDPSARQRVGLCGSSYFAAKRFRGSLVFDGQTDATLLSTDGQVLTTNAYVDVRNGAKLQVACAGTTDEKHFYVGTNSLLYTTNAATRLKYLDWIDVDGGTLAINHQFTYIGTVTLRNGGLMTSQNKSFFRLGNEPSWPMLLSGGTGTNVIDTGMYLYRPQNRQGTAITFITAGDLKIDNAVENTNANKSQYDPSLVRKLGPAKMILGPNCYNPEGANANTVTVEVVHGTLRVESPRAIRAVNGTLFHAGTTLDLADNVTMTTGVFTVDVTKYANATERASYKTVNVTLGAGAGLVVPQASNFFVTNGCTLVFNDNIDGRRVRIGDGTAGNRLSAEQLSRIRHDAGSGRLRRVIQDDDGYLAVNGLMILVR